ncbi:two-component regulator propeller domain-containing protein, partial [Asticcacaulis benevestitus]|uniref:ligand-binding sensor domain-containing protein n=1 Tax=Asticcacaulis benevestitus TaxID=347481 RepID=UPI001F1CE650
MARWDGYRFRGYRPNAKKAGTLPDNDIHVLFVDMRGTLWVGTGAGGLARYDAEQDSFVTYTTGPDGLSHVTVAALAEDGKGGLWIGTDGGLDHLDIRTGKISHLKSASLPDNQIGALLCDRAGTLWVGTAKGLTYQKAGATAFTQISLPTVNGDPP